MAKKYCYTGKVSLLLNLVLDKYIECGNLYLIYKLHKENVQFISD